MRGITSLIPVVLLAFLACSDRPTTRTTPSLKDSVLEKYIRLIDSSGEFDTAELNYGILRAYASNDTTFFRQLSQNIDNMQKLQQRMEDSCVHQLKLQDLQADEAYRFIYTGAFCPYRVNITVSRRNDNITLHFILYQFKRDTTACRIINEYDKALTTKDWEDIRNAIKKSDFWGLKRENGIHGFDGDNITVTGYQKAHLSFNRTAKFNHVNRWSLATLADPFMLVMKLSGNRQGCLRVK